MGNRTERGKKAFSSRRSASSKKKGIPLIFGVIILLCVPLFFVLSSWVPESPPPAEKSSQEAAVPDKAVEEEKDNAKEGKAPEMGDDRKFFTKGEWNEARKLAEEAIKQMHRVRVAFEDGTINLDERQRRNREVGRLFDKAISTATKLLKRVPEEHDPLYEGYGAEVRSWILKNRRLIK